MSNQQLRFLSAFILLGVGLTALTASHFSRAGFAFLILSLGGWEFSSMVEKRFSGPGLSWLVLLFVAAYLLPHLVPGLVGNQADMHTWLWICVIVTVLTFTLLGFRYLSIENMAPWIFFQILACLSMGIWGAGWFSLFTPELGFKGIYPLLAVLIAMTTADTGAYYAGRSFGKHKLCPSISPKKTVEGAIGGTLLTIITIGLLGPVLLHSSLWKSLGLGVLLSVTAICGDLLMSALKRFADVKDSSRLIPGHGGILDRFDSLLMSGTIAAFYIKLV